MTLSQYLLAQADARGFGAGLFHWRPAVTMRWTLTRVLARVAVQTAGFAVTGLVLSLLIYRQVLAWPVWWLGWFGLCRGLVHHGLTALVWNQRANRLRANPQLPLGMPPSRIRPLRWLAVIFYFFLVEVATPLGLWVTVENAHGKFAWIRYQAASSARGEDLDPARVIPPAVPDDQNLALTPLLRPVYEFTRGTNGASWRDTNAYAHVQSIRVDLGSGHSRTNFPGLGNLEKGTLADLDALQGFYRGNTNYPQASAASPPAVDILTALGKFDPDLDALMTAAAARPYSRFPIHYEDEPAWMILLPHLANIKGLCQVLALQAIAHLELHQSDAAFADLKLGFRLSDSIRDEPFLIDYLVRVASLTLNLEVLREGLACLVVHQEQTPVDT